MAASTLAFLAAWRTIPIAVKAWPISSWSSRARCLRSSSWTSTSGARTWSLAAVSRSSSSTRRRSLMLNDVDHGPDHLTAAADRVGPVSTGKLIHRRTEHLVFGVDLLPPRRQARIRRAFAGASRRAGCGE